MCIMRADVNNTQKMPQAGACFVHNFVETVERSWGFNKKIPPKGCMCEKVKEHICKKVTILSIIIILPKSMDFLRKTKAYLSCRMPFLKGAKRLKKANI